MQVAESFEALIISSERENARILAARLGEHGVVPTYCSPLDAPYTVLSRKSVRLVFCDSRLIEQVFPGLRGVIESRKSPVLPVILTRPGEAGLQIKGLEEVEIIAPPFEGPVIEQIIQKALASEETREQGH